MSWPLALLVTLRIALVAVLFVIGARRVREAGRA